MSRLPLRLATVAIAAASLPALVATPAAAGGDMFFSKHSGTTVSTTWLEAGDTSDAVAGNWHFGDLFVEETSRGRATAFGTVFDVTCEAGVEPYNPGGHGVHSDEAPAEPGEPGCVLEGVRFLDASPSQLTLNVDRKLTTATLKGNLSVGDGHGPGTGPTPPVDIVLRGVGSTYSSTESGTFTDEYGTYSYRYSFAGRDAAVAPGSRIGGMVFDDEDGESSTALMGTFRSSSRQRA